MVFMPPGSAKSTYVSKLFPPWLFARAKNVSIIGASHTSNLAEDFSRDVQRFIRDNAETLGYSLATERADLWQTTSGGKYYAFGVGGSIAGRRADFAIIDDPVKSRQDADSEKERERVWKWYLADLSPRLKPNARIILVQTRWHEDDLAGRLLSVQPEMWRVINLPAVAGDDDPIGRAPGEPLWIDDDYGYGATLEARRAELEAAGASREWASLYQQTPRPADGAIFKTDRLSHIAARPPGGRRVRAWDLAATEKTGTRDPDWTAGVLLQRDSIGRFTIEDVVRFRGGPREVEQTIVATAITDGPDIAIGLPQDPGQAGKHQAAYLTGILAGYVVQATPETGKKETRAMPVASQVAAGNVAVVQAAWNRVLIDELAGFPAARYDDQVDALSRAFAMLVTQGPPPICFTSA